MSKIKHIEFWVKDLEKSVGFYRNMFEIIRWEQVDENRFSDGETKIYFREQKITAQPTTGPRHICFLAESESIVEKVDEFLRKEGAVIIRGPIELEHKGRKSYTVDFKDPDGYILEVATRTQDVT